MAYLLRLELTHLQMSSPYALQHSHAGERWHFTDNFSAILLICYQTPLGPTLPGPSLSILNTCVLRGSACKLTHVLTTKMLNRSTDSEEFYQRLEELKSKSQYISSPVDIYIDDEAMESD